MAQSKLLTWVGIAVSVGGVLCAELTAQHIGGHVASILGTVLAALGQSIKSAS